MTRAESPVQEKSKVRDAESPGKMQSQVSDVGSPVRDWQRLLLQKLRESCTRVSSCRNSGQDKGRVMLRREPGRVTLVRTV